MKGKHLPYVTESGHEFYVSTEKNTAFISCMIEESEKDKAVNLSKEDILEMIETAKTYGITGVILNTDFGIDIHSRTLKTSKAFNGFFINKINNNN